MKASGTHAMPVPMTEGSDAINGVTEMVPAAQVACGL